MAVSSARFTKQSKQNLPRQRPRLHYSVVHPHPADPISSSTFLSPPASRETSATCRPSPTIHQLMSSTAVNVTTNLSDTRQSRAEFRKDRFPSRSNISMERVELFQATPSSLLGILHSLAIPSFFPPTQDYREFLQRELKPLNTGPL